MFKHQLSVLLVDGGGKIKEKISSCDIYFIYKLKWNTMKHGIYQEKIWTQKRIKGGGGVSFCKLNAHSILVISTKKSAKNFFKFY